MADGLSLVEEVSAGREAALKFPLAARVAGMSASKTMAVSALAEPLRRAGADVLDLGAGEPDFPTPLNVRRAAYAAMEGGHTKSTPAAGTLRLKQAIRERFAADSRSAAPSNASARRSTTATANRAAGRSDRRGQGISHGDTEPQRSGKRKEG